MIKFKGTPGGPVPRAAGRGAKKSGATNGGEPSEEDKENQTDDPARSSRVSLDGLLLYP